jgi:hypothetical protein
MRKNPFFFIVVLGGGTLWHLQKEKEPFFKKSQKEKLKLVQGEEGEKKHFSTAIPISGYHIKDSLSWQVSLYPYSLTLEPLIVTIIY